ncbi:MAG TPA: LysR substrate-binding domain-containing protein [Acidisoma sp.]|jgi:LysR family glycine cleavage system transcriptional activator|uniref:LysR substrate-binding domain-containing protein n=1 Tax=Acidisoma sp. TaxID=1872115 RepID=UPI002BB04D86|nr:LysR substrate-binding domain-containing protein [Acidisoma sp.]HTI03468.1 LysR substrate-binding domain-containing protein [Acidisoma sp.]
MAVIDRRWLPLNALRAFEAVGRQLSFTGGAQRLQVTQSALSRHVASLEDLLGRPLLERRPSGLALTPAGAALLPVVKKSFDRLEEVMNDILQEEAGHQRRLRLHMPPSFLHQVALPILSDFRREFPDILIDVSTSLGTGLPPTEVDVAVVYDRPQAGDTVRDLLWMVRVAPVCAPGIAAAAAGLDLSQFLAGQELLHVKLQGEPIGTHWTHFARAQGFALDIRRGMAFDTVTLAAQYAMAGQGVVLADIDMFASEIAAGRLVAPYDVTAEDGYGYYLAFHSEDLGDPVISLFRSWMIARLGRLVRKSA